MVVGRSVNILELGFNVVLAAKNSEGDRRDKKAAASNRVRADAYKNINTESIDPADHFHN